MRGKIVLEVDRALSQNSGFGVSHTIVGASLSEPHTSGTALRTCVCMFACLLAAIYRKFLMSTVKFQYYEHRAHAFGR